MTNKTFLFSISISICIFTSRCSNEVITENEKKITEINTTIKVTINTPNFSSDSAYNFIKKQVDFGPRIPNSKEHLECAKWLQNKMSNYNFEVQIQEGIVYAFNGAVLNMKNIIARYNSSAKSRILLCAHWDTRPFADRDTLNQNLPIDGANDGASGVGVLLEIARNISNSDLKTGIDIIFFDAEDYGAPSMSGQFFDINAMNNTWCLGSQYWCNNPTIENYKPKYGILLDMVGAKDAIFPKEGISRRFAGIYVNKIWQEATKLGYGKYFVHKIAPPITDDHTYLNQFAGIPTLDIIHYTPRHTNGNFDFGRFHHTHSDNMDIINKETLKAVGQTVLHVIFQDI